ncbi:unnamed protein product [Phytophthora lilii]|uniref:Unnamed protein product n=1 Tax=Phytophthora lilii TaxID=2077276 RepID=A0A9W7CL28_9STRA|nr:unnamed protein product [Phytophthora lilii]
MYSASATSPAVGHEQVEHQQGAAHEPHDEAQARREPPAALSQTGGSSRVVTTAASFAMAALKRDAAEVDGLVLVHQVGQLVAYQQQHGRHAGVEGQHGLRAGATAVDAGRGHHRIVEHEAEADERLQTQETPPRALAPRSSRSTAAKAPTVSRKAAVVEYFFA